MPPGCNHTRFEKQRGGADLAFHHFGLFLSASKILENWGFLQLVPAFIWQLPGCQEATVVAVHAGVLNCFSCVQLFATPWRWVIACQAPLSMGFSRQEHWSGWPCLSPGDLLNPGIELTSFTFPALAGGFLTTSTTWVVTQQQWFPDFSFLVLGSQPQQ